jgi:hypothetical protein
LTRIKGGKREEKEYCLSLPGKNWLRDYFVGQHDRKARRTYLVKQTHNQIGESGSTGSIGRKLKNCISEVNNRAVAIKTRTTTFNKVCELGKVRLLGMTYVTEARQPARLGETENSYLRKIS